MYPTIDINTSADTVDGTPSGQIFRPLRYTTSDRDLIRVSLWCLLSTIRGNYRFRSEQGLDVEAILDPSSSDEERSALVSEIILDYPGVVGILDGPTVTLEDGILARITVTANTVDGPITLSV